ncbi:accessory Sec system protein Asp2, partial [Staphylococcus haemolyticus]
MARKFRILQVGGKDLEPLFDSKKGVEWDYLDDALFTFDSGYIEAVKSIIKAFGNFDLVFVQSAYSPELMDLLRVVATPHNTVIDAQMWSPNYDAEPLIQHKFVKKLNYQTEEDLHHQLLAVTFPGQYGDRVSPIKTTVNPHFQGTYKYEGNKSLVLEGDFGTSFKPIVTWIQSLVSDEDKVNELWPEYSLEGDVEIEYTFRLSPFGSTEYPDTTLRFEHKDLNQPIQLPLRTTQMNVSVSLKAKGKGKLRIGAIH